MEASRRTFQGAFRCLPQEQKEGRERMDGGNAGIAKNYSIAEDAEDAENIISNNPMSTSKTGQKKIARMPKTLGIKASCSLHKLHSKKPHHHFHPLGGYGGTQAQ